jgi:hypothetical protein
VLSTRLAFSLEGLIIIDLVNTLMDRLGWDLLIIACLTLGLAPYRPPHVWEKLVMLSRGRLRKPLDWFDLFLHGTPWILLVLKILLSL